MPIYLKYNTASQEIPLGYFVDSGDGNTEETALTIANTDIHLWKAGATTLADKNSGGATHISNGIYYAVLDATDTNTVGPLIVFVHVSGALAVRVECVVLPAKVYDSLIAGTDNLEVDVIQLLGTAWLTPAVAGTPDVNSKQIGGTAQTAGDVVADVSAVHGHVDDIKIKTDQLVFTVANRVDSNALQVGDKTGYSIGTGGIAAAAFAAGAIDASALAADAAAEIADKILGRNLAGGSDGGRTVTDALRILRNKRSIAGGTLTVTQEDDTTAAWTAAVATAAGNPISSVDPA